MSCYSHVCLFAYKIGPNRRNIFSWVQCNYVLSHISKNAKLKGILLNRHGSMSLLQSRRKTNNLNKLCILYFILCSARPHQIAWTVNHVLRHKPQELVFVRHILIKITPYFVGNIDKWDYQKSMIKVLFKYKSKFSKCAWHDFFKTEVSKRAIKTLQMNSLIENLEHKIDF